eukprot:SAG25_NODE_1087_length_4070_cov_7.651977_5_plen_102_part_00
MRRNRGEIGAQKETLSLVTSSLRPQGVNFALAKLTPGQRVASITSEGRGGGVKTFLSLTVAYWRIPPQGRRERDGPLQSGTGAASKIATVLSISIIKLKVT